MIAGKELESAIISDHAETGEPSQFGRMVSHTLASAVFGAKKVKTASTVNSLRRDVSRLRMDPTRLRLRPTHQLPRLQKFL